MKILLYIVGPVFFIYIFYKVYKYFNTPIEEESAQIDLYNDEYEDFI